MSGVGSPDHAGRRNLSNITPFAPSVEYLINWRRSLEDLKSLADGSKQPHD
jgi:hypothetical protein